MTLDWQWPAARRQLRAAIAANLDPAGIILLDYWRTLIGIMGPPRSSGFDPPHIDTGALIHSADYVSRINTLEVFVGGTMPYLRQLELGTPKMLPRPSLARALAEGGEVAASRVLQV